MEINLLKFKINDIINFKKAVRFTKIGETIIDELEEAIECKKIPNVFVIKIDMPYTTLSTYDINNGFCARCDYVKSYFVKNPNGAKRLKKLLGFNKIIKHYPTIVDEYFSDRSGERTFSVASEEDMGSNVVNKIKTCLYFYNKYYSRNIKLELDNNERFKIIDIVSKVKVKYDVYNKPYKEVGPILTLKKSINAVDYYYELDPVTLELSPFDLSKDTLDNDIGDIVLYNKIDIPGNRVKYLNYKFKKISNVDECNKDIFSYVKYIIKTCNK